MTQKERIEALERKIVELEARIAAQEARPYYWPQSTTPAYPPYWPYTTWYTSTANGDGAAPVRAA